MTYQKIKEKLVDTEKVLTAKELRSLTTKLALFIFGICMILTTLTIKVFGASLTIVVIFLSILSYLWTFDYMLTDVNVLRKFQKTLKLWWLTYIVLVAEYIVLTIFRF